MRTRRGLWRHWQSAVQAVTRTKIERVMGITELGLVEMTRKKVRQRLSALLLTSCDNCGGSGKVYSPQAMAMRVRREVNRVVMHSEEKSFLVEVAPAVGKYITRKTTPMRQS